MDDVKYKLAEKIKARMAFLKIGKKQLAEIMEITPSNITRFISGKHNFTVETLIDIQRVLGIKLIDVEIDESYSGVPCAPCNYFSTVK